MALTEIEFKQCSRCGRVWGIGELLVDQADCPQCYSPLREFEEVV